MQKNEKFDLVVLGGGPGGYVAAIRAAQLGLKVVVVEKDRLGGVCLNWGCIPTKALLRSAEIFRFIKSADEFGLEVKGEGFDIGKVVERSKGIAEKLSNGIQFLLKKNKVSVVHGYGKLLGGGKVSVDGSVIEGQHIVIATGARPRILPGLEHDGEHVWTYREALRPKALPKSILIIGSGPIGMEFASFYSAFGVKVTVLEAHEHILRSEDREIAELAEAAFKKQGIVIKTNAQLKNHKFTNKGIDVEVEAGGKTEAMSVEKIILAVGVLPNTEDIGLENTKVVLEHGIIKTDEYMRTDEPGIYAIGDVTQGPWLAHKASHEGIICVEKIAGLDTKHMEKSNIPGCTYCYPQIASVGMTEEKAKELKRNIRIGKFPFSGNGKALAMGEGECLIKTIFDKDTGELLGAHMIGAEVTELIQGFVIGKVMEATEEDFIHAVFPHPTLSEMMQEATLSAFDRALHI